MLFRFCQLCVKKMNCGSSVFSDNGEEKATSKRTYASVVSEDDQSTPLTNSWWRKLQEENEEEAIHHEPQVNGSLNIRIENDRLKANLDQARGQLESLLEEIKISAK